MQWAGELLFGESWAVFSGFAAENTPHAHGALQVVFANKGKVTVFGGDGSVSTGVGFAIRPLVEHHLAATSVVTLLYIEPQSPLAFIVGDEIGDAQIAPIAFEPLAFEPACTTADWATRLTALTHSKAIAVDQRLLSALASLAAEPGSISIVEAARGCDLSESRLRTLARQQLGLPLYTWLIWRKLERTARARRLLTLRPMVAFRTKRTLRARCAACSG